jgi:hypothetical protein
MLDQYLASVNDINYLISSGEVSDRVNVSRHVLPLPSPFS